MLLSPFATTLLSSAALAMIQPAPADGDSARAEAVAAEEVAEAREEAAEAIEEVAEDAADEAAATAAAASEAAAEASEAAAEAREVADANEPEEREICRRTHFTDDYGRTRSRRVCRPASEGRPL
jgi:minor extracellular protease Epr